jgi:Tfp pilus assembly protein PilV
MVDACRGADNASHACAVMQTTREMIMTDQVQPNTEVTTKVHVLRAFAAASLAVGAIGIVVGFGGMVWLHTSSVSHAASGASVTGVESTVAAGEVQGFLHAPASWPSVPRAEDVFANHSSAPVDVAPAPSL